MEKKIQISDSEWQIMKVIWANSPIAANDIIETLGDSVDWAPKTIKTLINRLVSKEVLGYTKEGRTYLYYPLITSKETIAQENRSFLSKVHNGSFASLVASFVDEDEFTDKELEELKKLLDSKTK